MLTSVNLRKAGQGWEFDSEAALEDFVWTNLKDLLGLIPLKRQYYVLGQVCDILALGENKQLVVLDLKNGEDRYIVQQLTRYYDALREDKPFKEEIDYEQPIGLLAIAPSFHRDNFTDRKYNPLSVQFLHFETLAEEEKLYLQLKDIDSGKVSKLEIPHQQIDSTDNIPSPPRALLNLLYKFCDSDSKVLLQIRQKILSFDKRMQETSASGIVSYGKGKSKHCAEFYGKKELYPRTSLPRPFMVLYLPIFPRCDDYKKIGRMIIYRTAFDNNPCLSYIDEYSYIDYKPKASRSHSANQRWDVKNYIRSYLRREGNESPCLDNIDYLDFLVELALSEWLKRL